MLNRHNLNQRKHVRAYRHRKDISHMNDDEICEQVDRFTFIEFVFSFTRTVYTNFMAWTNQRNACSFRLKILLKITAIRLWGKTEKLKQIRPFSCFLITFVFGLCFVILFTQTFIILTVVTCALDTQIRGGINCCNKDEKRNRKVFLVFCSKTKNKKKNKYNISIELFEWSKRTGISTVVHHNL